MAKYGTAALFLLASMMMRNVASDCAFPLVNSVYCPLHDVSVLVDATEKEATTFGGLVNDAPTEVEIQAGSDYLYDGVGNDYNKLKTYPSYTTTKSEIMMCYEDYYGVGYSPNDVVKTALDVNGVMEYSGPALTQHFDESVRSDENGIYFINEESAKKITQYTTTLLEMYQLMEQSVQLVKGNCISYVNEKSGATSCQDAVNAWDNAAAVQDGPNYLGGKRCANYNTCGWNNAEKGIAIANQKVLNLFQVGQNAIRTGDIVGAKGIIKLIQSAQLVSYIQGVGRYAWKVTDKNDCLEANNKEYAEGMAFATGLLPQLYKCNRSAARTVDKTFQLLKGNCFGEEGSFVDFIAVLRSEYQCLGITCEDVGGLLAGEYGTGDYEDGAAPCVTEYGDHVVS